jgi:hypothetical protein
MAHTHESNTGRIWKVFGLLSIITIVEVAFGIYKPAFLYDSHLFQMNLLNWLFIILTVVKAYYIMWAYARCLSHLMYIFCIFMGDGIIIDNKQASKPWSSLSDRDLIWANDIPRCLKGAIRSGLNLVFALYNFYPLFKVFQK